MDLDDLADHFEEAADTVESRTHSVAREETEKMADIAERRLEHGRAVASGSLLESIDVIEDAGIGTISLVAGGQEAPYAPFVEFGTGIFNNSSMVRYNFEAPSTVSDEMVSNLEQWIQQKGITPLNAPEWMGPSESVTWLAEAIAYHIVDRGTEATPFMRPAFLIHKNRLKRSVFEEAKETVEP